MGDSGWRDWQRRWCDRLGLGNQTRQRSGVLGWPWGRVGAELLGTIQLELWVWHRGWAETQAFQGAGPVPSLQAPSLRVALHSTDGWKPVSGSLPDFSFSPRHSTHPTHSIFILPLATVLTLSADLFVAATSMTWCNWYPLLSIWMRLYTHTGEVVYSLQRHLMFSKLVMIPQGFCFSPKPKREDLFSYFSNKIQLTYSCISPLGLVFHLITY